MTHRLGFVAWLAACVVGCGTETPQDGPMLARANTDVPTTLEIVLSNVIGKGGEPACESSGLHCGDTDQWQFVVRLDWAKLSPGNVFPFGDVLTGAVASGAAEDGQCGGGPITNSGAIEVIAATSDKLSLRVRGTTLPFGTGETFDGDYDVVVCREEPADVYALRHAIATTDTSGVLSLHVASVPPACSDADVMATPGSHAGLLIQLPPVMQAVGTYALGGHTFMHFETPSVKDGGEYNEGTLQITQIDATEVHFEIAGTGPWFSLEQSADGTFVAQRCP